MNGHSTALHSPIDGDWSIRDRIQQERKLRADRMLNEAMVILIPELIVAFHAKHLWIFGSVATKTPSENSDLDILIESGNTDWSFKKRLNIASDIIIQADLPFACDVIVWTSGELNALSKDFIRFILIRLLMKADPEYLFLY